MEKRKVPSTVEGEVGFGGYQVRSSSLNKNSKVNWPKSHWVHLFEMLRREKMSLILRENIYCYAMSIDGEITLTFESPKSFAFTYKKKCQDMFQSSWKKLKSQGRIARELDGSFDCRGTTAVMRNNNIHDKVREFVVKGRLQLLPCQSLLHTYYPTIHTKRCPMCNHPSDTASHALNGCTKYKDIYQARHNRLVDIVHSKLEHYSNAHIIKDKMLKPEIFDSDTTGSFRTKSCRPDITIIDKERKKVKLVEIAIPFDAFMEKTYKSKFNKYLPLALEINRMGFYPETIVLIIGSLGYVHNRFKTGIIKCGIPKREVSFLTNFCSISAIYGSKKVWNVRGRTIFLE